MRILPMPRSVMMTRPGPSPRTMRGARMGMSGGNMRRPLRLSNHHRLRMHGLMLPRHMLPEQIGSMAQQRAECLGFLAHLRALHFQLVAPGIRLCRDLPLLDLALCRDLGCLYACLRCLLGNLRVLAAFLSLLHRLDRLLEVEPRHHEPIAILVACQREHLVQYFLEVDA